MMRRLSLAVVALAALFACHGHSPTEPPLPNTPASLVGTWSGTLQAPNLGSVQLVINPDAATGQLNGRPVTVEQGERTFIHYSDTSPNYCVFTLIVVEVTADRMSGGTAGRCPSTITGSTPFVFVRVS